MKAIFGKKVGMTQVWDDNANVVPVTLISVEPNTINRIKTKDSDGYNAIQLSYGKHIKNPKKVHKGQFKDREVKKYLSEIKVTDTSAYKVGQVLKANIFSTGQFVDVSGKSKGKGFAGTMKRHNFSGVSASHGAHINHRKPGSIGACATPGRVFKGLKMAGRMGGELQTVQNLIINSIDLEHGIIGIKGAVPGSKNSFVKIQSAIKKPGANDEVSVQEEVIEEKAPEQKQEEVQKPEEKAQEESPKSEVKSEKEPEKAENTNENKEKTEEKAPEQKSEEKQEKQADNKEGEK